MYLNAKTEIIVTEIFKSNNLKFVKGKEKFLINTNRKDIFLDLLSLSIVLNTNLERILELINFNTACKNNLAFYRGEDLKVIRLINVESVNQLIRNIQGLEFDIQLLKKVSEELKKSVNIIKK